MKMTNWTAENQQTNAARNVRKRVANTYTERYAYTLYSYIMYTYGILSVCRTWILRITKESRSRATTFRTELIKPPASEALCASWSQSQFQLARSGLWLWLWHMEIIKSAAKHQAQSSKKASLRRPPNALTLFEWTPSSLLDTLRHIVTLLWHFVLLPLKKLTHTHPHSDILATCNTQWTWKFFFISCLNSRRCCPNESPVHSVFWLHIWAILLWF